MCEFRFTLPCWQTNCRAKPRRGDTSSPLHCFATGHDGGMERLLDTTSEIDKLPWDGARVVEGAPTAGARPLAAVAGAEIGVWEMTPGISTDVEVDEVFVVLSGSASIAFEDGEEISIGPGSAVRLRAGDKTTWTVQQTLRKIYVL